MSNLSKLSTAAAPEPSAFLRMPNVIQMTGLGRSTIYRTTE